MTAQGSEGLVEVMQALAGARAALARTGTTERVAALLRTHILQGLFPPGSRLSEELLVQALGVSRNTLREAFRLLAHERLTIHQMHRGTFVPVLTDLDVTDIYALRRLVECGAARNAGRVPRPARQAVLATVEEAETFAEQGEWLQVRTADLRFHRAVVGLAGIVRIDDLIDQSLAELRLAFHVMDDPEAFHGPYLVRNRVIAELIVAGQGEEAAKELEAYLDEAEQQVLASYRATHPARARDEGLHAPDEAPLR